MDKRVSLTSVADLAAQFYATQNYTTSQARIHTCITPFHRLQQQRCLPKPSYVRLLPLSLIPISRTTNPEITGTRGYRTAEQQRVIKVMV